MLTRLRTLSLSCLALPALAHAASGVAYAYGSRAFTGFVAESYRVAGKDPEGFYTQMDRKLKAVRGATWTALLEPHRRAIAGAKRPDDRAKAERALGHALHWAVKKSIPRFSLDRGFEFVNTIERGERQCFLQAVLIAGLIQRAGARAGVVMVWKSPTGLARNNAHACVLVKLSDGRDLLVDASETRPFPLQRGLFSSTASGAYRYVEPQFAADHSIVQYRLAGSGKPIANSHFQPLGITFLRSQFDYYRGERAPQGVFDKRPTRPGLARSAKFLERSVAACPENPLAVYMLGNVQRKLGRHAEGAKNLQRAERLYLAYGYLPDGPRQAVARLSRPAGP